MPQAPCIWVIDDDEATLDMVARAFKKEHLDCQLKAFADTESLLTEIQRVTAPPRMLLVDYSMPDMNGLQLIERLNNNPSTRQLRMILFSRYITPEIIQKAEHLHVYQIESKPTELREWRELVKELCSAGFFP